MKNSQSKFRFFLVSCYFVGAFVLVTAQAADQKEDKQEGGTTQESTQVAKKMVSVYYDNESLIDVINTLASHKNFNVVFPTGAAAINAKVTVHITKKMTSDEAWDFLHLLLSVAGYSIVQRGNEAVIVKTAKETVKEPFEFYIDVPYEKLPDTQEYIRCLFYLSNMKVSDDAGSDLMQILSRIMPDTYREACQLDPVANALIITERASLIKSVMHIISILEQTEFKEKLEIIPLFHTLADDVAKLFNETLLKSPVEANRMRLDTRRPIESTYFSRHVKIIPESRLNVLIVLGKEQAIERISSFIRAHIDVEPESGKSVFHVYHLQYLDAATFAPILRNIVGAEGASSAEGTGQSRAEAGKRGGVEKFFEGVRIIDDAPKDGEESKQQAAGAGEKAAPVPKYFGGNKLIIAARQDDYARITEVIQDVDVPRKQVVLEVLVTDLNIEDRRMIGTILRNPITIPLPRDIQGQSAHMGPNVLPNSLDKPTTIGVGDDLLKKNYVLDSNGQYVLADSDGDALYSVASTAPVGASVLSFNEKDGRTWGVMEVLKGLTTRKVISNPHVIAVDNQPTEIIIGETRLLPDQATGSSAGAITIPKIELPATITIRITPRINTTDEGDSDSVHLSIYVEITDFKSGINATNSGDRYSRKVITSAYVPSGYVLPLGGLLDYSTVIDRTRTPLLSRIPIIGNFFKSKNGVQSNTNLTVFICPRVIKPSLRAGMAEYTKDYVKLVKRYSQTGDLFDSLKDPITRWFFKSGPQAIDVIEDFLMQDERNADIIKPRKKGEPRPKAVSLGRRHAPLAPAKPRVTELESLGTEGEKLSAADFNDDRLKSMLQRSDNPLMAQAAR